MVTMKNGDYKHLKPKTDIRVKTSAKFKLSTKSSYIYSRIGG